jgi:hypothetical protein
MSQFVLLACMVNGGVTCTLLQVSSVVLADSGTLLLCSIDRRADITKLRQSLRAAHPGMPLGVAQLTFGLLCNLARATGGKF